MLTPRNMVLHWMNSTRGLEGLDSRHMSGFGQYLLATWKGNIGDDDGVEQTNTSRSNSYLLSRPRALLSPVIENSTIWEPTRGSNLNAWPVIDARHCMWVCDPGVAGQPSHSIWHYLASFLPLISLSSTSYFIHIIPLFLTTLIIEFYSYLSSNARSF